MVFALKLLAVWFLISIPASLIMGRFIARGMGTEETEPETGTFVQGEHQQHAARIAMAGE